MPFDTRFASIHRVLSVVPTASGVPPKRGPPCKQGATNVCIRHCGSAPRIPMWLTMSFSLGSKQRENDIGPQAWRLFKVSTHPVLETLVSACKRFLFLLFPREGVGGSLSSLTRFANDSSCGIDTRFASIHRVFNVVPTASGVPPNVVPPASRVPPMYLY